MTRAVNDARSNAPENIEYAVQAIGRSKIRRALFEAVYHHMGAKTATMLGAKTGLTRERVIKEIRPLANRNIVIQSSKGGDITYGTDPFIKAHKSEVLRYLDNPKRLQEMATKRRPTVALKVRGAVELRTLVVPAKSVDARLITVDDIAEFSAVKGIIGNARLPSTLSETQFKNGIQRLVDEPGAFKDWGGEKSDLFSTRLTVEGKRRASAFAFKGPGLTGKLTIARMGKNGDQAPRLFQEPGQVFLVQHWREIDPSVLEVIQSLAIAKSVTTGTTVWYGIIDGKDSDRIRQAYPAAFE